MMAKAAEPQRGLYSKAASSRAAPGPYGSARPATGWLPTAAQDAEAARDAAAAARDSAAAAAVQNAAWAARLAAAAALMAATAAQTAEEAAQAAAEAAQNAAAAFTGLGARARGWSGSPSWRGAAAAPIALAGPCTASSATSKLYAFDTFTAILETSRHQQEPKKHMGLTCPIKIE